MGVSISCGVWDFVESFVQNRVYIQRGTPNAILGGWGAGGLGRIVRIYLTYNLYHVEFNYRMNLVPVT
jgi:hypothetical protein